MPLSGLQRAVLRRIAAHRSPDSYVAGATVLHRDEDSPRYSQDLDVFHDQIERVAVCAELDFAALSEAGFDCSWVLRTPSFHRAIVRDEAQALTLEWAQDSVFRFFPVVEDEQFGYRLHDADAAINKLLALAGRDEIRDFVDMLHVHGTYLSLGALAWAACGKDPGYTPDLILQQTGRHVAYTQNDLDRLQLKHSVSLQSLKRKWLRALADADNLVAQLPAEELGCLYLNAEAEPVTPDPASTDFPRLTRHTGCVRGAWPTFRE